MRTTLRIDDALLSAVKALAKAERKSVGEVMSTLAWRGLRGKRAPQERAGSFPVFQVAPDSQPICLEDVKRAEEEGE